jgi:hypothetical protein
VTGGRRRLCRENGVSLVTGCAATGAGPGNRVAWLSRFGSWPVGWPVKNLFQLFKSDLTL